MRDHDTLAEYLEEEKVETGYWSNMPEFIVSWDEAQQTWTGVDVPDFEVTKPPSNRPPKDAKGMAAIAGDAPFIMKPDGRGWLYAPTGLKDGPLPTHYEPVETPVPNLLYRQQDNPVAERYDLPGNTLAEPFDPDFPVVGTTVRLTEHYLSGPMSRFNSWLNELQPEMFVEISPKLAAERGIEHGGWLVVTTKRSAIEARAMVTRRVRARRPRGGGRDTRGCVSTIGKGGLLPRNGDRADEEVPCVLPRPTSTLRTTSARLPRPRTLLTDEEIENHHCHKIWNPIARGWIAAGHRRSRR